MSAVRLDPVMSPTYDAPGISLGTLAKAAAMSGTICSPRAYTIWHGATIDAPRPPQPDDVRIEPVCATRPCASVSDACVVSAGAPSEEKRTLRHCLSASVNDCSTTLAAASFCT